MRDFFKFYHWGIYMKSHMALYTMALIFIKSILLVCTGEEMISVWVLLEMLVTGLLAAMFEVFCFPEGKEFSRRQLIKRTILWAVLLNVTFISGSLLGGWFEGITAGWTAVLVIFLEGGLLAMWVGVHVASKVETNMLNHGLEHYKSASSGEKR